MFRALVYIILISISLHAHAAKPALILLDMQLHWMEKEADINSAESKKKIELLFENQIEVIKSALANRVPIIVVEYSDTGDTFNRLMTEMMGYSKLVVIKKTARGLFDPNNDNKLLALKVLESFEIDELVVIGANGGTCIKRTVVSAIKMGFKIWAFPDGIADFNYFDIEYPYYWQAYEKMDGKKVKALDKKKYTEVKTVKEIDSIFESAKYPKLNR